MSEGGEGYVPGFKASLEGKLTTGLVKSKQSETAATNGHEGKSIFDKLTHSEGSIVPNISAHQDIFASPPEGMVVLTPASDATIETSPAKQERFDPVTNKSFEGGISLNTQTLEDGSREIVIEGEKLKGMSSDTLQGIAESVSGNIFGAKGESAINVPWGDPAKVGERVIREVIENSVDADGTRIKVRAVIKDGKLDIQITDNGAGFPQSVLDHGIKQSTKELGQEGILGGAGVGSKFVDGMVSDNFNGEVIRGNLSEGGASVTISIPYSPEIAAVIGSTFEPPPSIGEAPQPAQAEQTPPKAENLPGRPTLDQGSSIPQEEQPSQQIDRELPPKPMSEQPEKPSAQPSPEPVEQVPIGKVKEFVQQNYGQIEGTIREAIEGYNEFAAANGEESFDSSDPFSAPFCEAVGLIQFDTSGGLSPKTKDEGLIQVVGDSDLVPEPLRGKRARHTWAEVDGVIIDPTIGQAIDLDRAIAQFPHLFQGRVFVGTPDQALAAFGLKYRDVNDVDKKLEEQAGLTTSIETNQSPTIRSTNNNNSPLDHDPLLQELLGQEPVSTNGPSGVPERPVTPEKPTTPVIKAESDKPEVRVPPRVGAVMDDIEKIFERQRQDPKNFREGLTQHGGLRNALDEIKAKYGGKIVSSGESVRPGQPQVEIDPQRGGIVVHGEGLGLFSFGDGGPDDIVRGAAGVRLIAIAAALEASGQSEITPEIIAQADQAMAEFKNRLPLSAEAKAALERKLSQNPSASPGVVDKTIGKLPENTRKGILDNIAKANGTIDGLPVPSGPAPERKPVSVSIEAEISAADAMGGLQAWEKARKIAEILNSGADSVEFKPKGMEPITITKEGDEFVGRQPETRNPDGSITPPKEWRSSGELGALGPVAGALSERFGDIPPERWDRLADAGGYQTQTVNNVSREPRKQKEPTPASPPPDVDTTKLRDRNILQQAFGNEGPYIPDDDTPDAPDTWAPQNPDFGDGDGGQGSVPDGGVPTPPRWGGPRGGPLGALDAFVGALGGKRRDLAEAENLQEQLGLTVEQLKQMPKDEAQALIRAAKEKYAEQVKAALEAERQERIRQQEAAARAAQAQREAEAAARAAQAQREAEIAAAQAQREAEAAAQAAAQAQSGSEVVNEDAQQENPPSNPNVTESDQDEQEPEISSAPQDEGEENGQDDAPPDEPQSEDSQEDGASDDDQEPIWPRSGDQNTTSPPPPSGGNSSSSSSGGRGYIPGDEGPGNVQPPPRRPALPPPPPPPPPPESPKQDIDGLRQKAERWPYEGGGRAAEEYLEQIRGKRNEDLTQGDIETLQEFANSSRQRDKGRDYSDYDQLGEQIGNSGLPRVDKTRGNGGSRGRGNDGGGLGGLLDQFAEEGQNDDTLEGLLDIRK